MKVMVAIMQVCGFDRQTGGEVPCKVLRESSCKLVVGKSFWALHSIFHQGVVSTRPRVESNAPLLSKDILQMVKLYQAIASAPQPASDAPLDMMLPTQTENALTDTTLAIAEAPEAANAENKPD